MQLEPKDKNQEEREEIESKNSSPARCSLDWSVELPACLHCRAVSSSSFGRLEMEGLYY